MVQSSNDLFFLVVVQNNFTELKISVFKNQNLKTIGNYFKNDASERIQNYVYFLIIILTNTHDYYLARNILILIVGEFLVDWIKHFFIIKFHSIDPNIYFRFRFIYAQSYLSALHDR